MDGLRGALLPLATSLRLRGLEARGRCAVIAWGGEGKSKQKWMDEAFLQEKVACLDCPLTKNSLKEVCRGLIDFSTISHGSTPL
jgi:hypothetical protein